MALKNLVNKHYILMTSLIVLIFLYYALVGVGSRLLDCLGISALVLSFILLTYLHFFQKLGKK